MEELRVKKECNEEKEKTTRVFVKNSTQTGKHLCIIACLFAEVIEQRC